jgi:lipopolysaccharide export system permease protein
MTVMVFTFVLLLGNALREILILIINGQATLWLVLQSIGLLIPFVLVYALPMGMLTATLLVFGRFSADQELTAVRASGVSLLAVATPVLWLSVAASCLSAFINMELGPLCRTAYLNLVYRVGIERATSFIVEDRFMDEFDDYVVYVGRKNGNRLEDLLIYELDDNDRMKRRLQAARAEVLSDTEAFRATLRLYDVHLYDFETWQSAHSAQMDGFTLSYQPTGDEEQDVSISDMTFFQLRQKLSELESFAASARPLTLGDSPEQQRRLEELKNELTTRIRVQMHRQIAFSFACIGFTLVGIPLGIRAHRRETSIGFAMAIVLVAIYFGFVILAQSLEDRPQFGPQLILWLPNFVFQTVGVILLWRTNRGI